MDTIKTAIENKSTPNETSYSSIVASIWGVSPTTEHGYPLVQEIGKEKGEPVYAAYNGDFGVMGNDEDGWELVHSSDGERAGSTNYARIAEAAEFAK